MKIAQSMMTRLLVCATLLGLMASPARAATRLDQNCVISVLNRTVQVNSDGGWSMPNVPSSMGRIKARATCVQGGQTISGESAYFNVTTNGVVQVGDIVFEQLEPIPTALAYTNTDPITLTTLGATSQLGVTATYADKSTKDVSKSDSGINYTSSNPSIAQVSLDGLVTAKKVGTVIVTARKDGVTAFIKVVIGSQGDSDGDGIPDDYEKAHGLNPNDPTDAQEDPDKDGLSTLQEYGIGTDPWNKDTDGDGLSDGDEFNSKSGYKTNPLSADTDGDGLNDGVEIKIGSNPLDPKDPANFSAALVSISATPNQISLPYNSIFTESTQQIKVTGVLIDGSTLDLTSKSRHTSYATSDIKVVSFGAKDGLLYAGQAGTATVTVSNSGLTATASVTVETFNPTAMSKIAIPGFANSVTVAGNYAYVAAGSKGLVVVDVTDRKNPKIVSNFDSKGTGIHVAVVGDVAYLADGDHGLLLIDVSDPANPRQIAVYDMAGIAQYVKVDNQYAYVAAGAAGLEIVDVRNVKNPVQAGHLGYLGTTVSVDADGDVAVVLADSALRVVDVHDKLNPVRHGSINIGPVQEVVMKGSYAYVAAYTSGLQVINIADLDKPTVTGTDAFYAPRGVALTDGLALFAEVKFVNGVPYENVADPNNIVYQGFIDFSAYDDYNGLKIALDGAYVYMTAEAGISPTYQADGSTHLYIGQYLILLDLNGVAPTVNITNPQVGTTMMGGSRVTLSANASDDVSVQSVNFLVNGKVVYTDTSPPYQTTVDIPNDGTTTVTLGATALDYGKNVGTAKGLTLSVQPDTDNDRLGNDDEMHLFKTDPNNPDTDTDGLSDGDEVLSYHTDPLNRDTDGDGIPDGMEILNGTDPLNPDTTPPLVSSVTPEDGGTDLPEDTAITIVFNEALQPKSIKQGVVTVMGGVSFDVPVAGTVQLQSDGQRIVFTPNDLLDHNTAYQVQVANVRDVAGNPLDASFTSTFTTGYVVDQTPLAVTNASPNNGMANVPVNSAITVNLSKPVKHDTVTTDSFRVYDTVAGQYVSGTVSISADSMKLLFIPDAGLPVGRQIQVGLTNAIVDRFGNPLNDYYGYFTTAFAPDAQAPAITGASIGNGQTGVPTNASLNIRFNEAISSLKLEGIVLSQDGVPVTVQRTLSSDHQLVTLNPQVPMHANSAYTLTVDGVEDLSRNVLAFADVRMFTTASGPDTANPIVTAWDPAWYMGNVPLNVRPTVRFSERLDPTTIDTNSVALYDSQTGQLLGGTVSLSADGMTANFVPAANLKPNRGYYLWVSNWAYPKDLAGINVNGNYTYFVTGTALDTAAPKVTLQGVADGATGVPTNARLQFVFDQLLNDQCVGDGSVRVSANGVAVAGAAGLASDYRTLVFRPAGLLAANTLYTVQVSGLCDLAGNAMAAQTSSFTTSANATPVTSDFFGVVITPSGGVQSVNTPVTFTFDRAVDPTTLNGNLHIRVNGQEGIAGGYAVNGNVVTFTPQTPFPANATVDVKSFYGGVTDLAGNAAGNAYVSFLTSADIDATPPVVQMQTPADGSLDIGPATPVVLTFSKSLDANTVNNNFVLYANGAVIRPTVTRSGDNRTVTLTASLPASSVVSVIVTKDVKDLSGNRLADYVAAFTTAVDKGDTSRPSVVGVYPYNGSGNQLPDTNIVLFTNKPLDPASAQAAFHASQNGSVVKGVLTPLADSSSFQFTPAQPWAKGALVQVFFDSSAKDTLGNPLYGWQGSFRVEPDPATFTGSVVAVQPGSGGQGIPVNPVIDFQYNKALDPSTVNAANVFLYDWSYQPVSVKVSLVKGGRVIRMVPKNTLTANTYYYHQVGGGVLDLQGNPVYGWGGGFYTGAVADPDLQGPTVEGMSPPDGSENVGTNAHVNIRYNKPIDPISLAPEDPEATQYYGFSISWDNREVSYYPATPYPATSTVKVDAPAALDYAGNASIPHSVSFKTGAGIDIAAPGVAATSPASGATGVAVNAGLSVRFSEPLDPLTVNASSFQVYDSVTGQFYSGSRTVSADGRTLSFVPDTPWPVGRLLYSWLNNIQDLSGNAYTNYWYSFTTAFAADTQPPTVALASVADGQAGVPTNAVLRVRFSEAVNGLKLGGLVLSQGGRPVAAYVDLSDSQTVTLTPLSPLKANTAYQLTVSSVEDISGNVLANASALGFTTASGADTVNPVVTAWDPGRYIGGVPLNARPTVRFSERLDPATINTNSVALYDVNGQLLDGTVSLSADGMTATFVPAANLKPNWSYYIYVSNWAYPKDLAGNNVNRANTGFFTGTALDTAPPKVAQQTVADGATGVPVNAQLRFVFDQMLNVQCLGAGSVQVSANGAAVAGTASLAYDYHYTLGFRPAGLLVANTLYTVQISGLCDLAGNTMAAQTTSFTTSADAAAVTSALGLVITPSGGVQSVNTPVTFTFDRAVDPTTLNGNLHIRVNGQEGVAGNFAVSGNAVTFTPASPFPANATVEVWAYYGGVTDLAGNYTQYPYVSFHTSADIDATPPVVQLQTPADGSLDIGPATPVVLTFSKSLDANTVNNTDFVLYANGAVVRPTVARSGDNRTVTLTANLPASSVVSVIVTKDVKDLSGNRLADYVAAFTTSVDKGDTSRPSVIAQYPANGSDNQQPGAGILLYANKPLDPATAQTAFHASQNGVAVQGVLAPLANNEGFQFTPAQPWAKGALVQVFLDSTAKDALGNPLNGYQGSFRVEPDPATFTGGAVAVQPGDGWQGLPVNPVIDFQYNKSLDPTTVNTTNVVLRDSSSNLVPATVSLVKGGRVIRMVPNAPLAANSYYHHQVVGGVNDLQGNPVYGWDGGFYTQTDQSVTPDLQGPTVEGMSPPDSSENVGTNAHVHIRYSKPVDPVSLAPENPEATQYYGFSISSDNREVSYYPATPYPATSTVKVDAPATLDYAGNASIPHSVSFKTGAGIDVAAPGVAATSPASGATGVAVNAGLSVRYNEPLDPLTVNVSSFSVYDSVTGQYYSGSRTVSTDGRTLSFVPDAPWPVGRLLYYWLSNIQDLSGNASYTEWYGFTTSFAADTQAPTVAQTSVADGQAGVPTNAVLRVRFSEAVNGLTLGGVALSKNGQPVAAYVGLSDSQTVTVTPLSPLKANTTYQLTASSVEDISGNVLANATALGFTTASGADMVNPVVTVWDPAWYMGNVPLNAHPTVRFSERLDPATATTSSVALYDPQTGQLLDGAVSLSADGLTATFVPSTNLKPNWGYYIYVSNWANPKDLAGNNVNWAYTYFTTGN